MEKIKITIPDHLNPLQESLAIQKQLMKMLGPLKSKKMIGENLEVKHMETQIIINRVSFQKISKTSQCPICKTVFILKQGYRLYMNYGGLVQIKTCCKEECRNKFLSICGSRASIKKIKTAYFYSH